MLCKRVAPPSSRVVDYLSLILATFKKSFALMQNTSSSRPGPGAAPPSPPAPAGPSPPRSSPSSMSSVSSVSSSWSSSPAGRRFRSARPALKSRWSCLKTTGDDAKISRQWHEMRGQDCGTHRGVRVFLPRAVLVTDLSAHRLQLLLQSQTAGRTHKKSSTVSERW